MRAAEKVTIRVAPGTRNWLRWNTYSDHKRSQGRALATRRLIDFWETIRNWKGWTNIRTVSQVCDSERRWIRRNLYTLEIAGLLETRKIGNGKGVTEFRIFEEN